MGQYKDFQSILNASLGEKYILAGFRLVAVADDFLYLYYMDRRVATFNESGACIKEIRAECEKRLGGG